MTDFLQGFVNRLTNLSSGNRLLFLPRTSSGRIEDFNSLNQLEGKPSIDLLKEFFTGKTIRICPLHDARMPIANEVSQRLQKLRRTINSITEETGSIDLYVSYLFVTGKFSNGTPVRSPLLLIPAALTSSNGHWLLSRPDESRPLLNKSFIYAYAHHQQVALADNLLEEDFDEIESLQDLKLSLLNLFKESLIDLNFQTDFYQDLIQPFKPLRKTEFLKENSNGVLKVWNEALIGIFPQSDAYLETDYRSLISSGQYKTSDGFFQSLDCKEPLSEPSESRLIYSFPSDPWQEKAIRMIKRGYSIVVEGPPGTGKSQLICNLITDAIASKRNILVVSQKRAALEVIWERMATSGFNPFIAKVFDFKNDRRQVYNNIALQIQKLEEYRQLNNSIDSIQMERQFQMTSNRMDAIQEKLSEFQNALSDEQVCGMSIKEMYLHANLEAKTINLRNELHLLRMDQTDELEQKIYNYFTHTRILVNEAPSWIDRVSFSKWDRYDLDEILKSIETIGSRLSELNEPIQNYSGYFIDYPQFTLLANEYENIKMILDLLVPEEFGFVNRIFENKTTDLNDLWLANLQRLIDGCFQGDGVESGLSYDQLGAAQKALNTAMIAHNTMFRRLWWHLFSKDKFLIRRLMVAYRLDGRDGIRVLEKKLDNRLNLEHLISKLQEKDWTFGIPKNYHQDDFRKWFESTRRALRIHEIISNSRVLPQLTNSLIISGDFSRLKEFLTMLLRQTDEFILNKQRWLKYLTAKQIERITVQPDLLFSWSKELKNSFDRLQAADSISDSFAQWERDLLDRIIELVPDFDPDYAVATLHNSMLAAWINYLESRTPSLRMVSSGEMDLLEAELQNLDSLKRKISGSIVLLRARERMIEEVLFNRLNNQVTYRELLHQVTKKRKVWPLRKLISEFHDELFRIIPCWLASPDTVSAIFPLEKHFDLVIFDEASQCFPEWAIPAIARGKKVVVAGDSQQLRPSDFYRIRWQDTEDDPLLESESLLEMVQLHLPRIPLMAHYRSLHPDLIAFSNRHFYQDRLLTLPDRNYFNSGETAFNYLKVDGQWVDQVNQVEAETIVQLIWSNLKQSPKTSFGIVTFNQPQQQLILDVLESFFLDKKTSIPADLFVKNIENVQGDERDVIIFSLGYAPGKNKKVLLQFGSLNTEGGINRLNVAVTRSRKKMILVTSIEPEQLDIDGIKSQGPVLLKSWMEFVRERSVAASGEWQSPTRTKEESWYLSDRIRQYESLTGRTCSPPFSYADLVTLREGKFDRIILTDDERYLQSPSPKLYHCFLPKLFAEKNWPFLTCYSRNFWLNEETLIDSVKGSKVVRDSDDGEVI